ncbi:hypothetical protein [Corynebacterium ulceribovis]|uniref:hypothetical protein n=1 Tax=Corynebacterium ulceribovis TaxID=487732 RepID=UPI000363396C|nr:hypothetical protein [Corynebacterium ulceribovis]
MTTQVPVRQQVWRKAVIFAIILQAVVHAWVLSKRWFYWDDFLIPSRASGHSLWSPEVLVPSHDGHLAPAAFFFQVLVQRTLPGQWWFPALVMLLLSIAATWLFARAVAAVAGRTWYAFIVVMCFALSPAMLPAKSWWTASLNVLPWVLVLSATLLLVLRGFGLDRAEPNAPRLAVWPLAAAVGALVLVALLFFEKALFIPLIVFAVTLLIAHADRATGPMSARLVLVRGWPLWTVLALVTIAWSILWFLLVFGDNKASGAADWSLMWEGLFRGIAPIILGGPWLWERWIPGQPFALAPIELSVIALVVGIGVLYFRTARLPWLFAVAYMTVGLLLVVWGRRGEQVSGTIMLTLHYYADVAVVFLLCAAVAVRNSSSRISWDGIAAAVVVFSSLASSISYGFEWQPKPGKTWVTNAMVALRENPDRPLLNQFVPTDVMTPLLYPNNTTHRMFDSVRQRPKLARVTTSPWLLDAHGNAADAGVLAVSHIPQGPEPQCGTRVKSGVPQVIVLSSPLPLGMWTSEVNTIAEADGELKLSLVNSLVSEEDRDEVAVPAGTDPKQSWAQVEGAGGWLRAEWDGPAGTSVCLGAGSIGPLAPMPK